MTKWNLVPLEYTSEQVQAAYDYAKRAIPGFGEEAVKALAFDICGGYREMVRAAPNFSPQTTPDGAPEVSTLPVSPPLPANPPGLPWPIICEYTGGFCTRHGCKNSAFFGCQAMLLVADATKYREQEEAKELKA